MKKGEVRLAPPLSYSSVVIEGRRPFGGNGERTGKSGPEVDEKKKENLIGRSQLEGLPSETGLHGGATSEKLSNQKLKGWPLSRTNSWYLLKQSHGKHDLN